MQQEEFARQLTAEGFDEVFTISKPAGVDVPAHTHAFAVKALVTQGDVTLGVDGKRTTYGVGDVFTMAAGCEHTELYGAGGVSYVVGRKNS